MVEMMKKRLIASAMALFAAGAIASQGGTRVLTVDDVLKLENIGQAVIGNGERTLVYEWVVAHEDAPNLEVLNERGDFGPHAKLYAVDLDRKEAPRLLFPQEAQGGYWIGALSPDGARLAVYSLVAHEFKAGVYEFATGRLTWFGFMPNYDLRYMQHPTWISAEELAYVAMEPGVRPGVFGPYAITERQYEVWQKTFARKEASVSVFRSTGNAGVEEPNWFGSGTLLRVDARTGRTTEVDSGYFTSLTPSPDGRYLAALRFGGQIRATDRLLGGFTKHLTPLIYDLRDDNRKLSPCDDCHIMPSNLWWSADGHRLAFRAFHVSDETLGIHQYEPAAQSLSTLDERGLWLSCSLPVLPVGPGRDVVVFAQPLADRTQRKPWIPSCVRESRQDWFLKGESGVKNLTAPVVNVGESAAGMTRDGVLVTTADGEALILGADGKTRKLPLTRGKDPTLSVWKPWSRAEWQNGSVFPTDHVVLQTSKQVIYYDLKAKRAAALARPAGHANLLAMSPRHALFTQEADDGSARLLLVQTQQKTRELLAYNTHLRGIKLGSQVHIPYEFQGKKLSTCLLLPPNWHPGRRYPTIVEVYPGSPYDKPCEGAGIHLSTMQLFAARGYIVLYPPAPEELMRTPEGPTRNQTALALGAVDAAIAQGYVDPDRLGVYGMSQGFHSSLQAVTETNRFKAAVAANGISDFLTSYGAGVNWGLTQYTGGSGLYFRWGASDRYESPNGDNGLGVAPWVDPGRYTSNSPVYHADRIETPVLLLFGDLDDFGASQATEMFTALHRLRKEAQYALYWGEGHGNIFPANVRDVWKRMLDWYGRHLDVGGQPSANQTPGK